LDKRYGKDFDKIQNNMENIRTSFREDLETVMDGFGNLLFILFRAIM
jgi:hypothetical protein